MNLILARELTEDVGAAPALPAGIQLARIVEGQSPQFCCLDRLLTAHQFPAGWGERMLEAGDEAVVLVDAADGEVIAAGWIARRAFYVDEIRRSFDPGAEGDYYFGDFVSPPRRGRGLHRILIEQRLALSRAAGRRWALAMTRSDNLPSLHNYRTAGFDVAATLRSSLWGMWRCDRWLPVSDKLATGRLSGEGLALPGGRRLRRRC